ncbi:cupin fold metalloprotein, WbuC family, partial [Escherichia coli]|nr:cupin fold metalloprotein, WbuC family [Escherichia coli]
ISLSPPTICNSAEPGTTELMAWYAQAQVGDSTFAV